jgi:hypothetical protein
MLIVVRPSLWGVWTSPDFVDTGSGNDEGSEELSIGQRFWWETCRKNITGTVGPGSFGTRDGLAV